MFHHDDRAFIDGVSGFISASLRRGDVGFERSRVMGPGGAESRLTFVGDMAALPKVKTVR
jgi:hypothetical protein